MVLEQKILKKKIIEKMNDKRAYFVHLVNGKQAAIQPDTAKYLILFFCSMQSEQKKLNFIFISPNRLDIFLCAFSKFGEQKQIVIHLIWPGYITGGKDQSQPETVGLVKNVFQTNG